MDNNYLVLLKRETQINFRFLLDCMTVTTWGDWPWQGSKWRQSIEARTNRKRNINLRFFLRPSSGIVKTNDANIKPFKFKWKFSYKDRVFAEALINATSLQVEILNWVLMRWILMFYCTVELLQAKLRVCYVCKNEGWNLKKKKVRYDNYTSVGALDCKIFPIVLIFRPCCLQATKRN